MNTCSSFHLLIVCGLLIVGVGFGADGFVGVWKLNIDKSKLTAQSRTHASVTLRIKPVDPKTNRYTFDHIQKTGERRIVQMEYTCDGQEHPYHTFDENGKEMGHGGPGATVICRIVDDTTQIVENKRDGNVYFEATWKLTSDGRVLTSSSRSVHQDGKSEDAAYVYEKQ